VADGLEGSVWEFAAPSRRVVYLLGTAPVEANGAPVQRWSEGEGVRTLPVPPPPPDLPELSCSPHCWSWQFAPRRIWAASEEEAWALGADGRAVLRIRGDSGTLHAPPHALPLRLSGDEMPERLWAITGEPGGDIYGVGWDSTLLRHRGGRWERLRLPPVASAGGCVAGAAVVQGGALLIGGSDHNFGTDRPERPCLTRFDASGRSERLDVGLRSYENRGILDGRLQPDGAALFYLSFYAHSVAEVRGRAVRVYRFPTLRAFAGAAAVGRHLYAAGRLGDTAVVVRVPRR
jgi:hypothetical protein